jgi:hypothetical protein
VSVDIRCLIFIFHFSKVLPAIELAAKKIVQDGQLLANFKIEIDYKDTRCSSTYGPLAAFDLYSGKTKPG